VLCEISEKVSEYSSDPRVEVRDHHGPLWPSLNGFGDDRHGIVGAVLRRGAVCSGGSGARGGRQ